jgi:myosin heavy subunit
VLSHLLLATITLFGHLEMTETGQRTTEKTDDALMMAGKDVQDLICLTTADEHDVAVTLRARLLYKKMYTSIGSSVLVSLNPFRLAEAEVENGMLQKYIHEYKNPLEHHQKRLEPHIFQLTADAYLRMRRLAENQVILFRYSYFSVNAPQPSDLCM